MERERHTVCLFLKTIPSCRSDFCSQHDDEGTKSPGPTSPTLKPEDEEGTDEPGTGDKPEEEEEEGGSIQGHEL